MHNLGTKIDRLEFRKDVLVLNKHFINLTDIREMYLMVIIDNFPGADMFLIIGSTGQNYYIDSENRIFIKLFDIVFKLADLVFKVFIAAQTCAENKKSILYKS